MLSALTFPGRLSPAGWAWQAEEELEAAVSAALAPLRSKGRRRADSMDSASMCSKSSASAMAVDGGLLAAPSASGELAAADTGAMMEGEDEGTSGMSGRQAEASTGATQTAPRAEPFDMWAAAPPEPAGRAVSPTPPSPSRRRKRGGPYQLRPCNSFGDVQEAGWSLAASSAASQVEYYVLEWEADGGAVYDTALLEVRAALPPPTTAATTTTHVRVLFAQLMQHCSTPNMLSRALHAANTALSAVPAL